MTGPGDEFRDMVGAELAERIASIASDPRTDQEARAAAKERSDEQHQRRRAELAETASRALRGSWGKEAKAAVQRVLSGVAPIQAETAALVMCESIVREEQKRRRAKRKVEHFGRGVK